MKLRSAIFVVVLLLLTVTVCAAQSPMGFSPESFYNQFMLYVVLVERPATPADLPETSFDPGDEENGALMTVNDLDFISLTYSGDEVTEINQTFNLADNDKGARSAWVDVLLIFLTLETMSDERSSGIIDSDGLKEQVYTLSEEGETEYCGYHFKLTIEGEGDAAAAVIQITKK